MKDLRLKSITIVSHREGKARKEDFHPKRNLLVGRNHTGKSSIIKTIFKTLGAAPSGKLVHWDESCISLISLELNGSVYHFLHKDGCRAVFDENFSVQYASNKSSDWSEIFSKIFEFNLTLTSKENLSVLAGPACFFMPFYIDQDSGWGSDWKTFKSLYAYKAPNKSILEYFSGIKSSAYYEAKSYRVKLKSKLDELRSELKFLMKVKERIGSSIDLDGVRLSFDNFESEVKSLVSDVGSLEEQQAFIKKEVLRYERLISSIKAQIALSENSLNDFKKDFAYLDKVEELECPTCGAVHKENFIDYFSYVEDSRVLSEIISSLKVDLSEKIEEQYKLKGKLRDVKDSHDKLSFVLETKKEGVKLKDVIERSGAEQAVEVFYKESSIVQSDIDKMVVDIDKLDARLKELVNSEKTKDIMAGFRDKYSKSRHKLNLPVIDEKKISRLNLTSKPDLSGSGGPRSTLAFYSSIWEICYGRYADFSVPIVIDSPNQKGQDEFNLPKVLSFISKDLPDGAQVIISSEVSSSENFDKVVTFDKPYSILEYEQYDEMSSLVDPLVEKMMAEIFD